MSQPIYKAITLFTGFTEGRGSCGAGLNEWYREAAERARKYHGAAVSIHDWDADVADIAEGLWQQRSHRFHQWHVIVGYSYGGQAAANFAWELYKRQNVGISSMWLVDPVVRWTIPGLAAMSGRGKIQLPPTVDRVRGIYQTHRRIDFCRWLKRHGRLFLPAGHRVVKDGKPCPLQHRDSTHTNIDNDDKLRAEFVEYLDEFLEAKP